MANVPVAIILIGPFVAPIYKIKMKPCFMMATLIIRSQAECFPRDGEGTMFVHFPKALRTRWFEKSTDVCQLFGMDPGPHHGVGPGGVGKAQSEKAISNSPAATARGLIGGDKSGLSRPSTAVTSCGTPSRRSLASPRLTLDVGPSPSKPSQD